MTTTAVPSLSHLQVDRWASRPFNYPIDVFPEWRGKVFYLSVRYRARSRRPEDDFVVRHTRMTLTGFGRFDLASTVASSINASS